MPHMIIESCPTLNMMIEPCHIWWVSHVTYDEWVMWQLPHYQYHCATCPKGEGAAKWEACTAPRFSFSDSCTWHDAVICMQPVRVTRLFHMCDSIHSYVWHDTVMSLIYHMTHSGMWQDSCMWHAGVEHLGALVYFLPFFLVRREQLDWQREMDVVGRGGWGRTRTTNVLSSCIQALQRWGCREGRGGVENIMIHRCATATHCNTIAVCVAEQGVVLRRVAVTCATQHGSVAKEPYKRDYILQKKNIILSILLTIAIL